MRAAGGIVWRSGAAEPTVAIVHRPKGDWVLPKGKLKAGETELAAAQREVVEETGLSISVGDFAGSIRYEADGTAKIVSFWMMEAVGDPRPRQEDVDVAVWVAVPQALKDLSHPLERLILRSAAQQRAAARQTPRKRDRLRGFKRKLTTLDTVRRLRETLSVYEAELKTTIRRNMTATTNAVHDQFWVSSAEHLLASAKNAADRGYAETGWRCLKAAMRMEIYGLSDEELQLRAKRVLAESRKLPTWRKDLVDAIISSDGAVKEGVTPSDIAFATQIIHENEDNRYHALRLQHAQLVALGITVAVALILLVFMHAWVDLDPSSLSWRLILESAIVGVLGAAVSGILMTSDGAAGRQIPDLLGNWTILFARLAVGAATAIFLVALLLSGIVSLKADSRYVFLPVAFIAGFSERLARSAIERLGTSLIQR